jgi:hypothetical protein
MELRGAITTTILAAVKFRSSDLLGALVVVLKSLGETCDRIGQPSLERLGWPGPSPKQR